MSAGSAPAPSAPIDTLIEACLRGDQQAWETVVQRYRRKVFNVAYQFVGRHDEAEDLTQDIFVKIFRALHTFDRRANFQTWLISISRNLCIDHYRSVRKERETVDRHVDAADLNPVARGPDAFKQLDQFDRRELLRQAFQGASVDAALRRRPAGSPGAVLSGNRGPSRTAGRDREVTHQPGPPRARPSDPADRAGAGRPACGARGHPGDWSIGMNLSTDRNGGIVIVRVGEEKLVHPLLPTFAGSVSDLLAGGDRQRRSSTCRAWCTSTARASAA